jgi:hypothetical protein
MSRWGRRASSTSGPVPNSCDRCKPDEPVSEKAKKREETPVESGSFSYPSPAVTQIFEESREKPFWFVGIVLAS